MRRKQSGKPGATHLGKLTAAHGQGNYAQAKTHALNYAKAVHQYVSGSQMPMASDNDADDMAPAPSTPNAPPTTAAKMPSNAMRSILAKVAMAKRQPVPNA